MKTNISKLIESVRAKLGKHCVSVIDKSGDGQIAFMTDEIDRGEEVRGEWLDMVESECKANGIYPAVLPYPVHGRLMYCVAGLDRANQE